jgi:hypothetical protein
LLSVLHVWVGSRPKSAADSLRSHAREAFAIDSKTPQP